MNKKNTEFAEQEWFFDRVHKECTKKKRFVYFYEYSREYLKRKNEKKVATNSEIREASHPGDQEKGKQDFASHQDVNSGSISIARQLSNLVSHRSNIIDTPFYVLEEEIRKSLYYCYGKEVEEFIIGSDFLWNYAYHLISWKGNVYKQYKEQEAKYEKQWEYLKEEFYTSNKDPAIVWLIAPFNFRSTENQHLRYFKDFRRRALNCIGSIKDKQLVEEIKKESSKGKNEGRGLYIDRLKALGAFRAINFYGDWDNAFINTQTRISPTGYDKTPLYSDDKRIWERAELKVEETLRGLFGWP